MTNDEEWAMNVNEVGAIIDGLTKDEQHWFSLICVGMGDAVPQPIADKLIEVNLVEKRNKLYDVISYWVHYCWCVWCAKKEARDASNRPEQDEERPESDSLGGSEPECTE
jgi:hypothetical protein